MAANLVLGQPNFTTYVQINITEQTTAASATNMLNPVSVTSDGQRLYVADLANNRILIWKTIPHHERRAGGCGARPAGLVSSIPITRITSIPRASLAARVR